VHIEDFDAEEPTGHFWQFLTSVPAGLYSPGAQAPMMAPVAAEVEHVSRSVNTLNVFVDSTGVSLKVSPVMTSELLPAGNTPPSYM
jgi:hypothetical protein